MYTRQYLQWQICARLFPLYYCCMCATAMAFTCSNVLSAVSTVENWWGEDNGLGFNLYISAEKRKEIQQAYPDTEEQKRQLIHYWMSTDPLASWRRLITQLDRMSQSPVADAIRDFAEPLLAGIVQKIVWVMCIHNVCNDAEVTCTGGVENDA